MGSPEEKSSHSMSCCQNSTNSENISTDENSIEDFEQGNNNTVFHSTLENTVFSFPKRQAVDLEFKDMRFTVKKLSLAKRRIERKEILHGISGAFHSGELTAIMGPSGAGKSTILNILAGYVETGATGTVQVNGKIRSQNSESFRNLSCYIHQDDILREWLTVGEAMMFAAHLKLGYNVNEDHKIKCIKRILFLLGLDKRYNTFTGRLSGGQKKRLAIALEMISNPPILFLDEPTSGLDSSSCTQCISLLKRLAQEGRTVVCTIHQPSALLFEMFDKLYAVASGHCIYQGPVKELVPFLGKLDLHCPSYHNPADFLMEVAVGEYGVDVSKMINAALKKYYEDYASRLSSNEPVSLDENESKIQTINAERLQTTSQKYNFSLASNNKSQCFEQIEMTEEQRNSSKTSPASIFMQFWLLYKRNLISQGRNYWMIVFRLLAHIGIAVIFGYLYIGVGAGPTQAFANYVYLFGSLLLVVYTGKMSVMMSFPVEMESLTREHFNRWYKLGPYFLSIILFEIPVQIFCASLYLLISYYLTGNYYNAVRLGLFVMTSLLATLGAQSWGFFIGATLPVKLAVFVGPILAVLYSVFGFCNRYADITPLFRWMWNISYFRAGFHGVIETVYGMDRPFFKCPDSVMYCHFRDPRVLMSEMMVENINFKDNIILMASVIVIMHILTVIMLWFKLNKR